MMSYELLGKLVINFKYKLQVMGERFGGQSWWHTKPVLLIDAELFRVP